MMKSALFCLLALSLVGCTTSSSHEVKCWPINPTKVGNTFKPAIAYNTVRIGSILVVAPYSSDEIVVRRADGSIAKDPYNRFAAGPARLLAPVLKAACDSYGAFAMALPNESMARPDVIIEAVVTDLSLDCSDGNRNAVVAVTLTLVDNRSNVRQVLEVEKGEARISAADGDYGKAFTTAFDEAVKHAFKGLDGR